VAQTLINGDGRRLLGVSCTYDGPPAEAARKGSGAQAVIPGEIPGTLGRCADRAIGVKCVTHLRERTSAAAAYVRWGQLWGQVTVG
jgi:hypothetical protein